ncbi:MULTISPECIES: hypothetical protein [unclassified Burkholderia]|uniref:hypothetical protein n=1 Tax=unclassified Burkholderia TaxID=2613784 RepID=UPI00214F87C0|nr:MULTISPECIES: hypothetical protein [unclassified Burkholderia]MCR4469770.1 hypothetical protein [Burkholderia sp. SCN-KJ]
MSIPRIGIGYTPPDLFTEAEADAAQQQAVLATPQPHHRHALSRAKRQSLKKRRSAESPDANDPASESEELLMMLDQHLRRDQTGVLKVDARDSRGSQHGFDHDDHCASPETAGKRSTHDDDLNLPARELPMHLVMRDSRDESVLSKHWRTTANDSGDDSTFASGARAEAALLGIRASRAGPAGAMTARPAATTNVPPPRTASTHRAPAHANAMDPARQEAMRGSSTYQVLAIVREFMRMPDDSRTSRATLAQVRERLVAAATQSGRDTQTTDARSAARRPLSPAEESMNLLLPIALLNLGRSRTRAGRAMGMSALSALIRRGRGW